MIKSAGDLAAKRVRPTAVSVQILFPESSDEQELKDIMRILTEICEETGLAITCVQAESAEYVLSDGDSYYCCWRERKLKTADEKIGSGNGNHSLRLYGIRRNVAIG